MADNEKRIPEPGSPEARTRNRLADDQLDSVSGGFVEYAGYAKNNIIECPHCHNEAESQFTWWEEKAFHQNGYSCKSCGFKFWVDGAGKYYDQNNIPLKFTPTRK